MACIMVVDDDETLAAVVGRVLRHAGYQVLVANSGPQALGLLRQQLIDLIVLDIAMPHMDGIAVCQYARSDPSLQGLPILFLTSAASIESKVEGFEAGGDDYLIKPFHTRELLMRVKALLQRSQMQLTKRLSTPLQVAGLALSHRTFEVSTKETKVRLTPVEFKLLEHLMRHAEEVFSAQELLEQVWDYPAGSGSPDPVRHCIASLRAKIEPQPERPIYILTVTRHGYTLGER